jgi:hypothetical protein
MLSANSGEDTSTGKQHMIYGTAGMLIMVSVYGIISLLDHTFNLNVANPNTDPTNINVSSRSIFGN